MKDRERVIGWAIVLAAAALCFTNLALKPPHPDEGGNGFFVNQIWSNGFYVYDPHNYHGPFLFYLFQISEKIFGFGIGSFRAVTALFAILSVWLVLRNRDLLGRYSSLFAAGALALSPGIAFFGRSAIHEAPFVFFQILLVAGILRMKEQDQRKGIIWIFAGLLGCILLKETFVILLFSLLIAWFWSGLSGGVLAKKKKKVEPSTGLPWKGIDGPFLLKLSIACVLIWLALFTGFFHYRQGAKDFFLAVMPWLKTGVGGAGHEKPFTYWLSLLGRYEWAAALGLAGAAVGLFGRSWKMRFFSALAIVNWLVYSLIAYKTPWCVITILWPMVITAGLWIEYIFTQRRGKMIYWLSWSAVAVIAVQSATASVKLNYMNYTDPSEPYVYVQTKNDIKEIQEIIRKKIMTSPDARNMRIQLNLNDSWPLPWLFSRFPNIGFGDSRMAFAEKADLIFAEFTHDDRDLEGRYVGRVIDLREARGPIRVYLRKAFFEGIDLPGFGPSEIPGGNRS